VDLLAPGVGEICGGSLREERFDVLQQLLAKTAFTENLDWLVSRQVFGQQTMTDPNSNPDPIDPNTNPTLLTLT